MSESDEPNSTPLKTFDTVVRRYPKPTNTNSTPPKSSKPSISEASKTGFFNRLLGKSKKPDTISSQDSNKPEFNQFSSAIPAPQNSAPTNSASINSASINSASIISISSQNRIDSPKLTPKQRRFKETKRFQEATSLQFSPLGSPKHFNGMMRPRSSSFTKKNCTTILTEQDQIKAAIEKAEEARSRSTSIVGDFSRDSTVATVPGKHPDLTYISLGTMVEMLESDVYEDQDYIIVDCRYPFEFNGGKIKSARNLYTWPLVKEEIYDQYAVGDHTPIIIFHCEFSSERAPKMYRTFRNFDRQEHQFPELKFPELYILKTGYKQFFEEYKEFCEGEYVLMADPRFSEELKHFRRGKSQTWTAHQNNPHKARRSTEKHVSRFRTKF